MGECRLIGLNTIHPTFAVSVPYLDSPTNLSINTNISIVFNNVIKFKGA